MLSARNAPTPKKKSTISIGVTRLQRRLRFRFAHCPACPSGFTFGEADLVTYDTRKAPKRGLILYRGNQIRTDDILLPKQTLYQAELHLEYTANIANYFNILESYL